MIIKSGKHIIMSFTIAFICIFVLFVAILSVNGRMKDAFLICAIPLLLVIRIWISIGRTLVICEEGMEVHFLWFRKKIKWNEFKVKRIEYYTWGSNLPDMKGIIFSTHKVCKPSWLHPLKYSLFAHPMSFIFVYFQTEKMKSSKMEDPEIYSVDEAEFMEKLKKWNVELE